MVEFRYILLHFLLILLTVVFCYVFVRKEKWGFWKSSLIPMIFFALEEGLRYGREIDWCVYYNVYEDIKKGIDTGHELLFTLIWKFFGLMSVPYPVLITICSFLLIFSIFYLFKPYQRCLYLIVPMVIIYCAYSATNLIRFFMGLSFLFISLRLFLDGKKTPSIIFMLCSVMTHVGLILLIPLLYGLNYVKRPLLRPKASITLCILLMFFFDKSILANFSFVFNLFQNVDRLSHYAIDGASWLVSNGDHDFNDKTIGSMFASSIPLFFMIKYSYRLCMEKKETIIFYNYMLVGMFLKYIASGLELMGRYSLALLPFIAFFLAITLKNLAHRKKKGSFAIVAFTVIIAFTGLKMYNFCTPIYKDSLLLEYVWDSQKHPSTYYYQYMQR